MGHLQGSPGTWLNWDMEQQFTSDEFVALADVWEQQQEILRAIADPETHAETAFVLGLDIPSLTSWYESLEAHA